MKGFTILISLALIGNISSEIFKECKDVKLGKNVPFPGDCNKYITCIGGGMERKCPDTLEFNAKKEVCDWPERANCGSSKSVRPISQIILESDESSQRGSRAECKDVKLGKNVPFPGDCNKYITCIGGGMERKCPDTLEFNAKKEVCDWPERANCGSAKSVRPISQIILESDESSQSGSRAECKDVKLGKNVPFPGDCNKYITCIGGGMERKCPDTLEFNAKKEVCDWPERANCGSSKSVRPISQIILESDESSQSGSRAECKDVKLGKNVPFPGDCNKYITCIGGGMERKCPDTLEFNAKKEVCDWPERANCGSAKSVRPISQIILESDESSQSGSRAECKDVKLGKNIPYPGDCNKYITCIAGGMERKCPDTLEFNAKKEVCDWPERANCGASKSVRPISQIILESDESSKSEPRAECKDVKLGKNIPFPGDCNKYITCIGGGMERKCPDTLEFNAKKEVCDWPERANCGASKSVRPISQIILESDESSQSGSRAECKDVKLGKNVPFPGDCNKYITCIGGGMERKCPDTLEFNAKKEVCDWPERANCGASKSVRPISQIILESDESSKSEPRAECKDVKLGKNIPFPGDCNKYITCIGGGMERKCPDTLEFNAKKEVCDWPERANCGASEFVLA